MRPVIKTRARFHAKPGTIIKLRTRKGPGKSLPSTRLPTPQKSPVHKTRILIRLTTKMPHVRTQRHFKLITHIKSRR